MKMTIIKIILWLFVVWGISFGWYTYLNTSIDSKIVDMQEKMLDSFFNLTNSKATWNTSIDASYETSWDYAMNIKSKIDLKDYTVNSIFFDSQIKWNLSWNIEGGAMWITAKIDLNTFFDFINKDWVYYFNLKNLDIKWLESNPLFSQANTMIEGFKEKFKDGSYYFYKDESFDMKKFSYMNLKERTKKSFFKVKNKIDDKYYIEPSMDFCNFINYISNEKDCTKEEYDDMLKEYNESVESYINYSMFWEKYLSISSKENKENSLKIYFGTTNIEKITFDLKEDWFVWNIIFVNWKSFDINFWDEAKTVVFNFNWVLNGEEFKSWKLNISWEWVKSNIVFENWNIDWKTQIILPWITKTEIITTWKYTSKSYDMLNKINWDLEYLWTKLDWDLSIKSDFSKPKIVSDLWFNINYDNMKIKFNLHDESIQTKKSDELKAPTNAKDISELMK